MAEIRDLQISMDRIKADAKKFNYSYDINDWASGECITIYQSIYYQIHYYFNKDGICEDVEVEEVRV